jgi:hypothetical protein
MLRNNWRDGVWYGIVAGTNNQGLTTGVLPVLSTGPAPLQSSDLVLRSSSCRVKARTLSDLASGQAARMSL